MAPNPRAELDRLAKSGAVSRELAALLAQLAASLCPSCGQKMITRSSKGPTAYLVCKACGTRTKFVWLQTRD